MKKKDKEESLRYGSTSLTELRELGGTLTELEDRFLKAQGSLHPRRRQMIRELIDHPEDVYFLSSRDLGKKFEVDAATIVRSIQVLGYGSYADFAADLRRHFVARITPLGLMQATAREKQPITDRIPRTLDKDVGNLHQLKNGLDTAQIMELARRIHQARNTIVVGVDLAYSLAWFLAYGLFTAGFQAEAPAANAGVLYHKVKGLDKRDLVIAISFGRCLRETVEAVRSAHKQGAATFGLTNSDTTPLAKYCDQYAVCSIDGAPFTGSYVAPMAFLNTVILACSILHPQRTLKRLRENEEEYTHGFRWYQEPPVEKIESLNGDHSGKTKGRKSGA